MPRTILIVDDDSQVRALCRTTLEETGYVVTEASDGKKALAAVEGSTFDLIVLDLSMPDMDGLEFLKAVQVKVPKLKIIVMSGFLGGAMLRPAKLFGASATLLKPFSPDSLLLLVKKVLGAEGSVGAPD